MKAVSKYNPGNTSIGKNASTNKAIKNQLVPILNDTISNDANANVSLAVTEEIPVGGNPGASAVVSADIVFVTDSASETVSVVNISSGKVVDEIVVGHDPVAIVYDYNNLEIYVVDQGSNQVTVINTQNDSIVATIEVGKSPDAIAYDSEN